MDSLPDRIQDELRMDDEHNVAHANEQHHDDDCGDFDDLEYTDAPIQQATVFRRTSLANNDDNDDGGCLSLKPIRVENAMPDADDDDDAEERTGRNFWASRPWIGNMQPPSYFDPSQVPKGNPSAELELDYAYGYRARQSRENIHWVEPPHTLIYSTASLCVVYNVHTREQKFYQGHTDDVMCLTYNDERRLAASGGLGKNNTAPICIWAVDDCITRMIIKGTLQYAVLAVAFSTDGSKVYGVGNDSRYCCAVFDTATGACLASANGDSNRIVHVICNSMEGFNANRDFITLGVSHIKFWSRSKGTLTGKKASGAKFDFSTQTMLSACCTQKLLLVGNVSGSIYIFSGDAPVRTLHGCHTEHIAGLGYKNQMIFSGGRDGLLKQWYVDEDGSNITEDESKMIDMNPYHMLSAEAAKRKERQTDLKRTKSEQPPPAKLGPPPPPKSQADKDAKKLMGAKKHFNSPRAIDVGEDGTICCGTHLGSIYVINGPEVTTVLDSHFEDRPGEFPELWGMAVHPTEAVFATCSDDATLRLWSVDLGTQIMLTNVFYPARAMHFSPDGGHICVGHTNGCFSVWDGMTLTPIIPFTRKRQYRITSVKYSPDGRFLALAMGRGNLVDIFLAKRDYQHLAICDCVSSVVLRMDWDLTSSLLRVDTAAYEVIHFNVPTCEVNNTLETCDVDWATNNLAISWGTQGIWEGCNDGTDVNCVSRSNNGKFIVAGYDSCTVRIFDYPCLVLQAENETKLKFPRNFEYIGHSSHVTKAFFTNDDKYVLTCGGMDLTVLRWKVVPRASARGGGDTVDQSQDEKAKQRLETHNVAEDVAKGKIKELQPDQPRPPAYTVSSKRDASMRLKQYGTMSNRPSMKTERPATASRLMQQTATCSEKARHGCAMRANIQRHIEAQKRFSMFAGGATSSDRRPYSITEEYLPSTNGTRRNTLATRQRTASANAAVRRQ